MSKNEAIQAVLIAHGVDPDTVAPNGQTAFQIMEAHIWLALDAIEDEDDITEDVPGDDRLN